MGTPLTVSYASDGAAHPALGVRGGLPGSPTRQFKRDLTGNPVDVPAYGQIQLESGETMVSITPGGGGYGPPTERDPQRVRHDVLEGWVTRERARDVYGVVLDPQGSVDPFATQRLREGADPPQRGDPGDPAQD